MFIPRSNPYGTGPSIRYLMGERNRLAICYTVHISAAYYITMSTKATGLLAANPLAPLGLPLHSATYRTPAGGSPLRSGEALDVALCAFVIQIFNIFAILPLGHALIVMPTNCTPAYTARIADVDSSDMLLYTEVHYPPNALMP
jgi:hypothetical protein